MEQYETRNKWENQYVKRQFKNRHRKSRNDKLKRRSSNSLKQKLRNGKFNLQLFNRIYTNRINDNYSLDKYLKSDNIYNDYNMILTNNFSDECDININNFCDEWECSRCTYINVESLSYCNICDLSFNLSNTQQLNQTITTHSSLLSYINHKKNIKNTKNTKNIIKKRKKYNKNNKIIKGFYDDINYKKYKKYMAKHNTSIIAFKQQSNNINNTPKINKKQQKAKQLYDLYKTVYLTTNQNQNQNQINDVINKLMKYIPDRYLKPDKIRNNNNNNNQDDDIKYNINTQCKVCFADDIELISMDKYCSHRMICSNCFSKYLEINIKSKENILPWLLCPAEKCKKPIKSELLLKYISINYLYKFAEIFLYKHLQRNKFWLNCPDGNNKKCKFGWIIFDDDDDDNDLICNGCNYKYIIAPEPQQTPKNTTVIKSKTVKRSKKKKMINKRRTVIDDGFNDLLSSGVLRKCPKCLYPTIKDYGMCNVMHCAQCGIYWNWRTKQVGSSSNDVKQKSRNNGTLWEPGELSYQTNLQRNNINEFKKLLARNGIKYDPNYRRGS